MRPADTASRRHRPPGWPGSAPRSPVRRASGRCPRVSSSMSTNTGFARSNRMAFDDATKLNGVVMTSSPSPMPRAPNDHVQAGRPAAAGDPVPTTGHLRNGRLESLREGVRVRAHHRTGPVRRARARARRYSAAPSESSAARSGQSCRHSIGRAGTPATRVDGATSRITVAPAATSDQAPIVRPSMTSAPRPRWAPSPTARVPPARFRGPGTRDPRPRRRDRRWRRCSR